MVRNLRWKIAQYLEIRWWKNYLKTKEKENYLHLKKIYWDNLIQKFSKEIKLSEQKTALDVGCGPSGIYLNLNHLQVDAVDPLVNKYKESLFFYDYTKYPNIHFINSAFENYTVDKQYDVVFSMNAINHVADLDYCFKKLVNYTKAGGYLVLTIDAHNYSIFKFLFRALPVDVLHPHQYDLKEYEDMLINKNCNLILSKLIKKEFLFDHYLIVFQKK